MISAGYLYGTPIKERHKDKHKRSPVEEQSQEFIFWVYKTRIWYDRVTKTYHGELKISAELANNNLYYNKIYIINKYNII